ncbi:DUF3124 domain-containing protein [Corallincola platygyrae]|uniref:DUF3124 domain-containing protein n=1 Tax=Corallincola platygyrae TaxID=1193278 RepID=A0ABW4XIY3_9GAMM
MAKEKFWVMWIAVAIIVTLVGTSIYLGTLVGKMEDMEDKLAFGQANTSHRVLQELPATGEAHKSYIPSYSHVYGDGGKPLLLETTLILRNTDPELPIQIISVEYVDSRGSRIEQMVKQPIELGPLASAEYLAKKSDIRGGSGASFVVTWQSEQPVATPIFEAVMVGSSEYTEISVTSRGQAVR